MTDTSLPDWAQAVLFVIAILALAAVIIFEPAASPAMERVAEEVVHTA